jgi:hypothetical protein
MCKLCETKPVYEFTNQKKLCKNCFVKYFEKKFFYTLRKFDMVKGGEIISLRGDGFRLVVLKQLMNLLEQKGIVSVGKSNKIAVDSTIDSESLNIIKILIDGEVTQLKIISPVVEDKNIIIKPLYLFLDKEILLYARIKKLKLGKIEKRKDNLLKFINKLEDKHPEVKRAVINSYLKIYSK